jgi:hypothetical protein
MTALRRPGWPGLVAALAALGLLLTFQQILAQAVKEGDLRRADTAAQVDGLWRCKLVRDVGARDACLAQVGDARNRKSPQAGRPVQR